MKVINDYCNHCNTERIIIEMDDEEGKPFVNLCQNCMEYALTLICKFIKEERDNARI